MYKEAFSIVSLPDLGDLYIKEILLYYIYPRAFVCENDKGTMYLMYELADINNTDNTDDTIVWLTVIITLDEYYKLVNCEVAIQDIYNLYPNDTFLIKKDYTTDTAEVLHLHDMPEAPKYWEQLPDESLYAGTEYR